jgi:outer membrane protein
MRTMSALTAGAAMIGALLSSGLALAQPATPVDVQVVDTDDPGQGINFILGAGPAATPDYEGSEDYEAVPFWTLRAGNLYHPETYVQVIGARLFSNFLPDDHWRLGIAGQFIRERNDVENNQVDELKSVDPSVMLGLIGGYDFLAGLGADLMLEVEGRQDVANDNGFLGTIRGRYGRRLTERWRIDTLVGTTWASEDYMSSYFSIDAGDAARSGLDQFSADEGFKEVAFGGSLSYRFLERWSASVTGLYTRLIEDAEESPVVDDVGDENQLFGGFLINYRF